MSTDRHLEDNADDQRRIRGHEDPATTAAFYADQRRNVRELEDLQARALVAEQPTPALIRGRHPGTSAIAGSIAGRDLAPGTPLTDLVGPEMHGAAGALVDEADPRRQVVRVTGARILAGETMEVRSDGRVYAADTAAAELAEDLVDVAETAAAVDQVDQALDGVAQPAPDYDFAEAIAGMANRHLQGIGLALEVVEACAGCGCTNRRACVLDHPRSIGGGMHVQTCHWIQTPPGQPPRCSSCGPEEPQPHEHTSDETARRRA